MSTFVPHPYRQYCRHNIDLNEVCADCGPPDPPRTPAPGKKYLPWAEAGGPNECEHGYAEGIPCPRCDSPPVPQDQPTAPSGEPVDAPTIPQSEYDWLHAELKRLKAALAQRDQELDDARHEHQAHHGFCSATPAICSHEAQRDQIEQGLRQELVEARAAGRRVAEAWADDRDERISAAEAMAVTRERALDRAERAEAELQQASAVVEAAQELVKDNPQFFGNIRLALKALDTAARAQEPGEPKCAD